jgi:hypothetical protein
VSVGVGGWNVEKWARKRAVLKLGRRCSAGLGTVRRALAPGKIPDPRPLRALDTSQRLFLIQYDGVLSITIIHSDGNSTNEDIGHGASAIGQQT